MKRLLAGTLFLLGTGCVVRAQENTIITVESKQNSPIATETTAMAEPLPSVNSAEPLFVKDTFVTSFANTRAAVNFSNNLSMPASFDAIPAGTPAKPSPEPKFLFGDRDDYRWQLALGIAGERFRSSIFDASAIGVNTSVTYYTGEGIGVEGSISALFAPQILANEHVKLLNYGAGPRIAWRQRRWEPFGHALFGGTHAFPQVSGSGKNGFAMQIGGGVDFRWYPRLSFRLGGDWVRTSLFGQTQNNFQGIAAGVIHF